MSCVNPSLARSKWGVRCVSTCVGACVDERKKTMMTQNKAERGRTCRHHEESYHLVPTV